MLYDSFRFFDRRLPPAAALAFPAFFSPFFDAFGGMMSVGCELSKYKIQNTAPRNRLKKREKNRNPQSRNIRKSAPDRPMLKIKRARNKARLSKEKIKRAQRRISKVWIEIVFTNTYQSCLEEEKEVKDSAKAAPSVTVRSFGITSKASPSQPFDVWLDVEVSSESPV